MQYIYSPYDPNRWATNLRYDKLTNMLMWDNAPGQDVFIVQTSFGLNAVDRMDRVCESLSHMPGFPYQYTEAPNSGSWVIAVSAKDKLRNKGCPLNGGASTYTVFSFLLENDVCRIFAPEERAKPFVQADIPQDIHIGIAQEFRKKGRGPFGKPAPTGFYSITFPRELSNRYIDGDLQYRVGNFMIPVTVQMLEMGTVYIKSELKPVVISRNPGLRIAD